MKRKKFALTVAAFLLMPSVGMAEAPVTTANVPVDSVYYSYIEKLSGMGYLQSLPDGSKPYSRMEMAKWVREAETKAAKKPMPSYLADEMKAMEKEFAPELSTLNGNRKYDELRLHSVTAEAAYSSVGRDGYFYKHTAGSWQPFNSNGNGYRYGKDGNLIASAEISGNIGHDTVIAVRPRFSYDKDDHLSSSLEEGYIKTRFGIWGIELGKQAMSWGEGATGTLAFSDNMTPLTMIQMHFMEPRKMGGFFRFLGEEDFHIFYGMLERNRESYAAADGRVDYNHVGLIGMRTDFTPRPYFTFGLERMSMLGGDGNALDRTHWLHWTYGKNDNQANDRWDDIAGGDFRFRFPGVQIYGEVYGEDQAGYLPSDLAYRFGVYLPRLTSDGSWDMTMETAKTNGSWYVHSRFQNGWTYRGDIMGDFMGTDSRKFYVQIRHFLPKEANVGLYVMHTDLDHDTADHPCIDEVGLTGQIKLRSDVYLNVLAGIAKVRHADYTEDTDHDHFVSASVCRVF